MANNTHISGDADAPPVTRILADFVATHPSQRLGRERRQRGAADAS